MRFCLFTYLPYFAYFTFFFFFFFFTNGIRTCTTLLILANSETGGGSTVTLRYVNRSLNTGTGTVPSKLFFFFPFFFWSGCAEEAYGAYCTRVLY